MTKWKNIAALSCAVILAISAAGCGKSSDAQDSSDTEAQTENSSDRSLEAGTSDGSGEKSSADSEATGDKDSADAAQIEDDESISSGEIPAVTTISDYDEDVYMTFDGLLVLSDGFEALDRAIHEHNAMILEKALSYKDELEEDHSYQYSNTAEITRCDDKVLSCTQESYCYLGQSDARPVLTGYTFDVNTGKELEISDVITDQKAFSKAVLEKLDEHPDKEGFREDWEDAAAEGLASEDEFSWCLRDDSIEVIFPGGIINLMDEVTVQISYDECSAFIKERYLRQSELLCHLVDDYGMTCLEYSFDADKDGKEELLQIDMDYQMSDDNYLDFVSPIISYGRDEGSLITADTSEYTDIYEVGDSYVMESEEGLYFLYVEVQVSGDMHLLLIYDLNDPDEGPVPMGTNSIGAFYGFKPSDPEQLYVVNRLYVMGTWTGYTKCHVCRNGQIFPRNEGESEYRIMSYDDQEAFDKNATYSGTGVPLTLKQDIETYVYDDKGDGDYETLDAGTKLYPYLGGADSYMVFRLEDGRFIQFYYDDMSEDDWERKIQGIPEEDLLDGMIYAG